MNRNGGHDHNRRRILIKHGTQPSDAVRHDRGDPLTRNRERLFIYHGDCGSGNMAMDPFYGNASETACADDPEAVAVNQIDPLMLVIRHGIW